MPGIMQTRYSFTAQFVRAGAFFANQARSLEDANPESASEEVVAEHRAYVVGAVMQCSAALEAEIAEVVMHGPGHQLGTNGIDAAAHAYLEPLADVFENPPILRKYEIVLHLLRRPPLDPGAVPYQSAALLIRLRNELVHYKSKVGPEMDRQALFTSLRQLGFARTPFESPSTNFFPHHVLSASLASWSVTAAVGLMTEFYAKLGMESPLTPYMARLAVPPIIQAAAS